MGRWTALLTIIAIGCGTDALSTAPDGIPSPSSSSSPNTPHPKSDAVGLGTPATSTGEDTPAARADVYPLDDALQSCADGTLGAADFEAAYAARSCEEWTACDGSECNPGYQSQLKTDPDCALDVEQACDCLQVAWECSELTSTTGELWVVVPANSCFTAYDCED